jgi:hypothetical protein
MALKETFSRDVYVALLCGDSNEMLPVRTNRAVYCAVLCETVVATRAWMRNGSFVRQVLRCASPVAGSCIAVDYLLPLMQ